MRSHSQCRFICSTFWDGFPRRSRRKRPDPSCAAKVYGLGCLESPSLTVTHASLCADMKVFGVMTVGGEVLFISEAC